VEPPNGTKGIHDFGERTSVRRLQGQIERWRNEPLRDATGGPVALPEWVERLPSEALARGESTVDVGKLSPHIAAGLGKEPVDRYALELHRMSAHHPQHRARPGDVTAAVTEEIADVINARRQPRFYRLERGDPNPVTPFETIERDLIRDVESGKLPDTPAVRALVHRAIETQRRLEIEGTVTPYHRWPLPGSE
jgi:hypothetical protein